MQTKFLFSKPRSFLSLSLSLSLCALLINSLLACASAPEVAAPAPAAAPIVVAAPTPTPPPTSTPTPHAAPVAEHKEQKAAHHHAPEGVSPEKALQWLKNGNTRFLKGHTRKDGARKKDIARLAHDQKPHTIILSCSDSRVPPEVVLDQKLGEIFVIRTAGEALEPTSLASIEYAVEHLGTRNIVVMGHTQCGAVKAAFSTLNNGKDAGSPNLNKLVSDIHPRIKNFAGKTPSKGYTDEVWANTKGVAQDLLKRSALIAEKVRSGNVKISSALYHLDAGTVDFAH